MPLLTPGYTPQQRSAESFLQPASPTKDFIKKPGPAAAAAYAQHKHVLPQDTQ
jgi:hypothetical protein